MIVRVGDQEVSGPVERDRSGIRKHCGGGRAAVAAVAVSGVSRERCDDAGRRHLSDDTIIGIGDVKVTGRVGRHSHRAIQLGDDGLPTIAVEARAKGLITRHGGDDARRGVDFPDDVVVGVGDEDVAGSVDEDALRIVQLSGGGESAVAGIACCTNARDHADDPRGSHLANLVVARIDDVEIA